MSTSPSRRKASTVWPVLFLLVTSPLVAEVFWGSTPIFPFSSLALLLADIGLYGCGALVIREIVHRRRRTWVSVLILGVAYAILEEGLLAPTWFTPQIFGSHLYGVAGGTYWTYAFFNIGYHAVFSITIPVLLTDRLFPRTRDRAWLPLWGTAIAGVVYALSAAAGAVFWFTGVLPRYYHVQPHITPATRIVLGLLVLGLVALGATLSLRRPVPSGAGEAAPAPPPLVVGLLAFGGSALWFGLFWVFRVAPWLGPVPLVVPLVVAVAIVASAAVILVRWSSRPGWSETHVLAVIVGALVCHALAGFPISGLLWNLTSPPAIAGKAILNVLEIVALGLAVVRLARGRGREAVPHHAQADF